jgi:histone H3/H4
VDKHGDRILPLAVIDRIFLKSRVAADHGAGIELGQLLETTAIEIVKIATTLTARAGRVTVTDEDIRLAHEFWRDPKDNA